MSTSCGYDTFSQICAGMSGDTRRHAAVRELTDAECVAIDLAYAAAAASGAVKQRRIQKLIEAEIQLRGTK